MTAPANEPLLREKAGQAIRRGALPAARPNRRFGVPGTGSTCAVCGEPVSRDQMAIELEFNRHGVLPGLDRFPLHPGCYAAWESVRTKIDEPGQQERPET